MSPDELTALSSAIENGALTAQQRRTVADLVHLVGTLHRQGAHTDSRAAYAFHEVVDVFQHLLPAPPAEDTGPGSHAAETGRAAGSREGADR